MSTFLLKHYRGFYLLLPVILGISLGYLAATLIGMQLAPPAVPTSRKAQQPPPAVKRPPITDYGIVLERNIFDYASRGTGVLVADQVGPGGGAAPVARPDLALLGTVTRGDASLAVIRSGQDTKTYRLGAELPGGGRLDEVSRHEVQIKYSDGSVQTLALFPRDGQAPAGASAAPARPGPGGGGTVRAVGENRYVIPQEAAEQARGNINELLKQARMEPNIVNGRTEGFVVRMIQPRSLLAELGIQRGDVVMQINGVSLDSPEKALQIFQQLREARNIQIGLVRNGTNMNFQYDVN